MTHLASFGPFVSIFYYYLGIFPLLDHVYSTKCIIKIRSDYLGTTTRETGPNDTRHVVWAIREVFIIFFLYLILTNPFLILLILLIAYIYMPQVHFFLRLFIIYLLYVYLQLTSTTTATITTTNRLEVYNQLPPFPSPTLPQPTWTGCLLPEKTTGAAADVDEQQR